MMSVAAPSIPLEIADHQCMSGGLQVVYWIMHKCQYTQTFVYCFAGVGFVKHIFAEFEIQCFRFKFKYVGMR